MKDYSNNRSVGMAINSGSTGAKRELVNLLLRAAEIAPEIGLYVSGSPYELTLQGIIGGLQRSIRDAEPEERIASDYDTSHTDHLQAIANALQGTWGYDASLWDSGGNVECILVRLNGKEWLFGTANDTWGASLNDDGSMPDAYIETGLPSEETNIFEVAMAIRKALVNT